MIEQAREWIGTPFVWDQSQKGIGCDCKGLIAGVFREIGRPEADSLYANFSGYRVDRPVPSSFLIEGFESLFDRVDEMRPEDILLLKHEGRAAHMAICTGSRAIHTIPRSSVKERSLEVIFHKFPLHSVWRCR